VFGDIKERLRLRVGEIELGGPLPQQLSERGAAQCIQEVDEPLSFRGSRTSAGASGRHDPLIIQPLNSFVN
jgi:hypothetical protein